MARRLTLVTQVTLPQMLGIAPTLPVTLLAALGGVLLWRWFRAGKLHLPAFAEGYLQPWKAALLLAVLGLGSALLVGMPFGVTTAYAKIGGFFESLLFPEHFSTLGYFAAEPLQFVHPLWGVELRGGAGPHLDGVALVQFPVIAGIIFGSAWSAVRLGEWHFYTGVPIRQCLWALFGGVLMGLASRMAPACNVWHLLGGIPILAGQSLLFLVGLIPGAWLGSKLLSKYSI
jgi:small basic protein